MGEQIKKVIDPIKGFWNNLAAKTKKIVLIVLGGILVISAGLVVISYLPSYSILYPGMDREEAMEVVELLDARDVTYKENNGTIMVPSDQEVALRMELANLGYPRTAPDYDWALKNTDIMTTDKEQDLITQYGLEQRLAQHIKSIECIKDAAVVITVGESDGYVLSAADREPSKAMVKVTLRKGETMTAQQVEGIKVLMASAVKRLTKENVAVIDNETGKEYSNSDVTQIDFANFKLEIEQSFESQISKKVAEILLPVFGEGNFTVTAKSSMDIDKKVQEIITYSPSGENNTGVTKNESHLAESTTEDPETNPEGVVGVDPNTNELPGYPGVEVSGNKLYIHNEDNYDYLVSQTTENIVRDSGELKDLSISAVVNRANLSEVERTELTALVAAAAGVPVEKVVLYGTQFFDKTASDVVPDPGQQLTRTQAVMLLAAAGVALLLSLVLIFVLLGRRKKKKQKAEADAEAAAAAMMYEGVAPLDPNGNSFDSEMSISEIQAQTQPTNDQFFKKEIQDFAQQNPEIAAQLIRTWLRGDDDNG